MAREWLIDRYNVQVHAPYMLKYKHVASVLLLLATFGVGSVWGASKTGTLTMSSSQKSPVTNNGVTFTWSSSNIITGTNSGFKDKNSGTTDMTITIPSGTKLTGISKSNSGNTWGGSASIKVYTGTTTSGTLLATIVTGSDSYAISSNNTGTTYYLINNSGANAWIYSLSVTYEESTCSKNVTISKGSETNGTFKLDKAGSQATCSGLSVVVTPLPDTHYHVGSVSANTGETGVNNGDGTWTITYAANTTGSSTINVTFEEDTKYTLNYHDGEGSSTRTNVYEGTNLIEALGTPAASCDATSKTFVGWSTTEITTKQNTPPSYVSASTVVNSTTAAGTYYAVYANVTGTLGKYKRVTKTSDIAEGGKVSIVYYNTSTLCGIDDAGTNFITGTASSETSNQITEPSSNYIWNISKEGNYWVFTNEKNSTKKLATNSTSSPTALNASTQTYYKWELGTNTGATNHFYLRIYDGSALTQRALQYYNSQWQIYGTDNYYSSNTNRALKLYIPAWTASSYVTTCAACEADPAVGSVSLKGPFSLSSVGVTATGCSAGANCSWTDYGFVWGTSENPTVSDHKVQVGTSGTAETWDGTLRGPFEVGTTYYYRAYGKNGKNGAEFVYGEPNSFTPRSITVVAPTGGTITADYTVASSGVTVTLTETSDTHYSFGSWTVITAKGTVTVTDNKFTMPDADVKVTAEFVEDASKTVTFKNNGKVVSKVKVYVGESPTAPALTDGDDACDANSTKHYGWTKTAWTDKIETKTTIDDKTGAETVYTKSADLPAVTAGDPKEIIYHAVWAEREGSETDKTIQINTDTLGSSGPLTSLDKKIGGITFKSTDGWGGQTYQTNYKYIQGKKNSNLYNSDAFPGYIKSVTITRQPDGQHNNISGTVSLCVGTSAQPTETCTDAVTEYNGKTFTYTATDNYTYLNIKVGETAAALANIQITYVIGSYTYSNFLTTCCDKLVTLSTNGPSNGTIAFDPESPVATCDDDKEVKMTITPAAGYKLSTWSVATGEGKVAPTGTSPSVVTGEDNSTEQVITLTFAQNTSGEYAVSATFEQMHDEYYDYMHDNAKVGGDRTGTYSAPSRSSKTAASGKDCKTNHYKFKGWVVQSEINDDGSPKAGYTLITAGSSMTASNKIYYAVWAEEE